ncbi:MAG: sigma-54-dependent Fis family transcriptional regulator [Chitinispirillaceae bacterium]|nr:sigma-54-dependent Fis family transcriptional regulator [Chitinispirillaceae bacterium]
MTASPSTDTSESIITTALRLTTSMAAQGTMMELINQGLSLCFKVLSCERGLLITENSEGTRQVIAHAGDGSRNEAFSTTALRLVKEKNEPLLISDTISDATLSVQESIASHDIRSVLCGRLDLPDRLFAGKTVYLYCDSHTNRHPLTPEDLEKFRLLSALMAHFVRKSELLAEQEARIEELKGLVSQKRFEDLLFGSKSFERCLAMVKQGAATDVRVLLFGETGTGKESLARIVHKLSRRANGPFLAVNCGSIPPNLIESELFGHEKGAFTGAVSSKKGYFEEADGGTLFLDEVGELPAAAQSHFLRVLQEGEVVRVGSTRPIKVDVRIVAATNVNLETAMAENRFRRDLFFRLNEFPVKVPAIREREDDALLLARYFLKQYGETYGNKTLRFSREAEKAIPLYAWPGNVRDIQNRVQRAVITASGTTIGSEDLGLSAGDALAFSTLQQARESVDRDMIAFALKKAPGNLTNAAKILDIDRKSLRLLLEKYGIEHRE